MAGLRKNKEGREADKKTKEMYKKCKEQIDIINREKDHRE